MDPKFAVKRWVESLGGSEATAPASDVYLGSHWRESLNCVASAREKFDSPELLVLSAGYGLIDDRTPIANYAASFAAGPDSMLNLKWPRENSVRENQAEWWRLLNNAWGRTNLAERFGGCGGEEVIVLILSREYFGAVEREVAELIAAGKRIYIVSAGVFANLSAISPVVRARVLPFNDRFKAVDPYLDKTNVSLNARLANWLITAHADALAEGNGKVFEVMKRIGEGLPDPVRKPVAPMTDEEVMHYIQAHFSTFGTSASALLRHLRDSKGLSCEQKRFGALFRRFVESNQGRLFDPK
jgi:hypothetical protein